MHKLSERRLIENEILFRQLNQQVTDIIQELPEKEIISQPLRFYCECSNTACSERIPLTSEQYQKLHSNNRRFVLKPGHNKPDIESIVLTKRGYIVVEKYKLPSIPKVTVSNPLL